MADNFLDGEDEVTKGRRVAVLQGGVISKDWEPSDKFVPWDGKDPIGVHTTPELMALLERDANVEIDARVICLEKGGKPKHKRMNRQQFLESVKSNKLDNEAVLREAVDTFATDTEYGSNAIVGGPDFVPLVGGPFFKQLYPVDYLKMHSAAFYAYHHDPVAKRVVQTMRDFTMGREWKLECEDKKAQALWDAFVETNELYARMDQAALELSIYGENFWWWLPNNEVNIGWQDRPGQEPRRGLIPRVRLVDPSVFYEIVTYPEDVERVLFYQWVASTQTQTYSGKDKGSSVGMTKFIFQQIPAKEIQHYKVNSVSNEKRGRSDLFPVLGYLKRLRDSVNYSIIALQKQAAWCIDTAIDGSPEDIDAYVADQQAIGPIAPAGSEFIHSKKVERTYLANQGQSKSSGGGGAFEWTLSMIASGTGIPLQYLGTHLSNAGTRASAVVATEPVVKLFEGRQNVYKRMIVGMFKRLMELNKIANTEHRIIFPELVVQDRSQKMADLSTAEQNGWISQRRAAEIAAKELGILNYSFDEERQEIEKDQSPGLSPLTSPGKVSTAPVDDEPNAGPTGMSGKDRRALDVGRGA